MWLSAVVIVVFPDRTHLLFLLKNTAHKKEQSLFTINIFLEQNDRNIFPVLLKYSTPIYNYVTKQIQSPLLMPNGAREFRRQIQ